MILAIDQGTTGSTCLVFDAEAELIGRAYREFAQHFPQPGWVEHDAGEIWDVTRAVAIEALDDAGVAPGEPGRDRHHQPARDRLRVGPGDRRAAAPGARLAGPPHRRPLRRRCASRGSEPTIRERTGLVLDPYFSGDEDRVAAGERRGPRRARRRRPRGLRHDRRVADLQAHGRARHRPVQRLAHDAVRPARAAAGTDELCALSRRAGRVAARDPPLDRRVRATARRRAARRTTVSRSRASRATSRRRCTARPAWTPGEAKNTYGTGSFVLLNAGSDPPPIAAAGPDQRRSPGRSGSARRTRLRRRSSSPAQACSGCATACGIIEHARDTEGAGRLAGRQRRRLPRARPRGPGLAALGPVRARDDRRPDARQRRARTWPARRSRRSPTRPSTPSARSKRAGGQALRVLKADGGATANGVAHAVPGRRARRAGGRARGGRDHGARRGPARGCRRRRLDAGPHPRPVARARHVRPGDGRGRAGLAAARLVARRRSARAAGSSADASASRRGSRCCCPLVSLAWAAGASRTHRRRLGSAGGQSSMTVRAVAHSDSSIPSSTSGSSEAPRRRAGGRPNRMHLGAYSDGFCSRFGFRVSCARSGPTAASDEKRHSSSASEAVTGR